MNKLRALAEAATPGPWKWTNDVDSSDEDHGWCVIVDDDHDPVALELLQQDAVYLSALNPTVALLLADVVDAAEAVLPAAPSVRVGAGAMFERFAVLRSSLAKLQEVMP